MVKADKDIKIVYYLYIDPNSNWQEMVTGQLIQLKRYGLLKAADLYIHICDVFGLAGYAFDLIKSLAPDAHQSLSTDNLYEYPGIRLIHQLALQYPNAVFAYFHAKGMSHGLNSRSAEEIALLKITFKNWRKAVNALQKKGFSKAGAFPAKLNEGKAKRGDDGGWIWYNYWFATGTYLSGCPEPVIHRDKYYYEGWLGLREAGVGPLISNDCYNLYQTICLNKHYFSPAEADHYLRLTAYRSNSTGGLLRKLMSHPLASTFVWMFKKRKALYRK